MKTHKSIAVLLLLIGLAVSNAAWACVHHCLDLASASIVFCSGYSKGDLPYAQNWS